jgi:hypothetical protein
MPVENFMRPSRLFARHVSLAFTALGVLAAASLMRAQAAPGLPGDAPPGIMPGIMPGIKVGGSSNMHVVAHIPIGGFARVSNVEVEQERSRPYAYVAQMLDRTGFSIFDLHDLANIRLIYRWTIENVSLHQPILGGVDGKYFKLNGRYYFALATQFQQGTPDAELGAVITDVTGLPDTSKVKIVARIRDPGTPGGFHMLFAYKHSDGRTLLFTTAMAGRANVYDLAKVLAGGDPTQWKVGEVPVPDTRENTPLGRQGYHDFYVAYDAATHQDKFYGAGRGGYYVYDVSTIAEPKLLTSITGTAGVSWGHTITPDPTGRFAVTETEYTYAPLRMFDLKPGLDGKVQTITQPIGAWNSDWHDLAHNHEVRWPFVFVSAYEDGLQVFSMYDPTHPVTVGWYYTCHCTHDDGIGGGPPTWRVQGSVMQGPFGIDVRNYDGLILISDANTGLWVFKMDGFDGWNGHDWGMPDISSVQDYDHGPEGAQPARSKPAA